VGRSRAVVLMKVRVDGKSNFSPAVDVSPDVNASEGRVHSREGSMGDILNKLQRLLHKKRHQISPLLQKNKSHKVAFSNALSSSDFQTLD